MFLPLRLCEGQVLALGLGLVRSSTIFLSWKNVAGDSEVLVFFIGGKDGLLIREAKASFTRAAVLHYS